MEPVRDLADANRLLHDVLCCAEVQVRVDVTRHDQHRHGGVDLLEVLEHAHAMLALCDVKALKLADTVRSTMRVLALSLAGDALLHLDRFAEGVALYRDALRQSSGRTVNTEARLREGVAHGLAAMGDVPALHTAIMERFRHAAQHLAEAPGELTAPLSEAGVAEVIEDISALDDAEVAAAVTDALVQAAEQLARMLPAEHRAQAEENLRLWRAAQ